MTDLFIGIFFGICIGAILYWFFELVAERIESERIREQEKQIILEKIYLKLMEKKK